MGQVIAFPLPPAPDADLIVELNTAESVLLTAVRWWVEAYRTGDDAIPRLCQELARAGAPDAAFSIDGMMTVVARTATDPVDIRCPRCPHLSPDERHLLLAAGLAQAGESARAAEVLRTTLLSVQGADFALAPLEGLGTLFARARLVLIRGRNSDETPWRRDEARATSDTREAWIPSHRLH